MRKVSVTVPNRYYKSFRKRHLYTDNMEAGTHKLAIGKVLCDGVSVISIDLSTDKMQQMVMNSVKNDDIDIGIIISEGNVVIAHSDMSELGRDYDVEVDSLGAMIAKNIII